MFIQYDGIVTKNNYQLKEQMSTNYPVEKGQTALWAVVESTSKNSLFMNPFKILLTRFTQFR